MSQGQEEQYALGLLLLLLLLLLIMVLNASIGGLCSYLECRRRLTQQ